MEKEIKVWLYDIKQAISEIEQFLSEKKIFQEFQKDLKSKRAVERNIEITGEAVNRILSQNKKIEITNSRKIVDTRNGISHGYDSVSDDIIWAIVIRDIPKLKAEIDNLLEF
ncbi:MAG: HepT-like ribonuclease domain-containing protein [Bacteroidia bacterium]